MGKIKVRSETTESNTSARPRPVSRASTTSAHTISEPSRTHSRNVSESTGPVHGYPASQYVVGGDGRRVHLGEQQDGLHAANTIDPSLQDAVAAGAVEYSDFFRQAQPNSHQAIFQEKEDSPFARANTEQPQDGFVAVDPQKKKGSSTSIANDQELRRLFHENKHRSLRDIADSVLAEERGPRSEKTKQIFAMIWLSTFCHKGEGSVPRNRVFSQYATKCGNERVPPLNPASFGKLVRIIFPGIQTRRLGMRGESKYHYVDLQMREDVPDDGQHDAPAHYNAANHLDEKSAFRRQRMQVPADTAVFPLPETITSRPAPNKQRNMDSQGCLFLDSRQRGLHREPSQSNLLTRELRFPSQDDTISSDDEAIPLPSLQEYLPPGTDPDSAEALKALYRAHCIAVIDAFRYCKEKIFYHAFTSFHGTLTVPVQKLLAHPDLAPWIKECDWIMYQKMICYVSHLALQVMPVKVLDALRTISTRLCPHILNTFQNHPPHVRSARHVPAVIFTSLLDRLLRVNTTAHAAANLLTDSAVRNQMWLDWALFVKPTQVVETCLPGAGYTRALHILTNEIRELLGPLSMVMFEGMQPIFQETAALYAAEDRHQVNGPLDTEGILDRWNDFLLSLPTRFPNVDARTLIDCIGQVGSAALRDLTVADARTFGTWWVTKTWIDEMLLWHAERGGFLERTPGNAEARSLKRSAFNAGFDADEDSLFGNESRQRSSYGGDFSRSSFYPSPQMMQCFDGMRQQHPQIGCEVTNPAQNDQHDMGSQNQQHSFYTSASATHRGLDKQMNAPMHMEYTPAGMILRNGVYAGHVATMPEDQRASIAATRDVQRSRNVSATEGNPVQPHDSAAVATTGKEIEPTDPKNHPHDDSGIGLDLELSTSALQRSPTRLPDYGSFVGGNTTGSDPADVVVC